MLFTSVGVAESGAMFVASTDVEAKTEQASGTDIQPGALPRKS